MPGSAAGGSTAGSTGAKKPAVSDVDHLLTRDYVQTILARESALPRTTIKDVLADGEEPSPERPGARWVKDGKIVGDFVVPVIESDPKPVVPTDKNAYYVQDMVGSLDAEHYAAEEKVRYVFRGAKRVLPSRVVLLVAHQACNGSGCHLQKVRLAQCANKDTRDVAAIEIYRKLTGDTLTPDHFLFNEKAIVIKRRTAAGEIPGPALVKWLQETPGCVLEKAIRQSKIGKWKPSNKDGGYKSPYPPTPPPAPGSLAAGAAPTGAKSGAFASKTISAGVPNLAKTPWSGQGGVLDVKDEKRNRTPRANRYDTTILNMTSNTSWRNQSCRLETDPMAEGSTWEKGKREKVSATRKTQGYWYFGGNGLHPSPTFASKTPRESGVFKTHETSGPATGPLKPVHGCTLRNPRRRPAEGSLEDIAWQAWTSSRSGRSSAAEERFVGERMIVENDGSIVVHPPEVRSPDRRKPTRMELTFPLSVARSSSAPPRSQDREHRAPRPTTFASEAVRTFVPEEKLPERPAPLLKTCDPWLVRDAFRAVWGFRPIDLFREILPDGETQLTVDDFATGIINGPVGRQGYIPDATMKDVRKTFRWFDSDAGGSLDIAELDRSLRKLKGERADAVRDAEEARAAGSGKLTREERLQMLRGPLGALPRALAKSLEANSMRMADLFKVLDTDGDGSITRKELHQQLKALGIKGSTYEIDVLFDYLDPDGSEGIEIKEFSDAMREALGEDKKELQSAGAEAVDELLAALALKKFKAVNVRKRLLGG